MKGSFEPSALTQLPCDSAEFISLMICLTQHAVIVAKYSAEPLPPPYTEAHDKAEMVTFSSVIPSFLSPFKRFSKDAQCHQGTFKLAELFKSGCFSKEGTVFDATTFWTRACHWWNLFQHPSRGTWKLQVCCDPPSGHMLDWGLGLSYENYARLQCD